MQKVEIDWLKVSYGHIAQIYSSGVEFCFISDDNKQCHPFVYCKDFLQDVVHGHIHKKRSTIYGFSYDPEKQPPLSAKCTKIALANKSDKEFGVHVPKMLDFINQFAKKLKMKPTKIFEAESPIRKYAKSGVYVTEGSARWMNSPPLLSMYTLLMRIGLVHNVGVDCMETVNGILLGKISPYRATDKTQLKNAIKGINNILEVGYRKFFYIDDEKNYPKNAIIDTMHNSCGIVGFSNGMSNRVVPYWHRKSIKTGDVK